MHTLPWLPSSAFNRRKEAAVFYGGELTYYYIMKYVSMKYVVAARSLRIREA